MALKLVPDAPKPERTDKQKVLDRVAAAAPAHLLKCPRCGCMEFIETRVGVEKSATGKPKGGTKALLCLLCLLMRQQRVEIR